VFEDTSKIGQFFEEIDKKTQDPFERIKQLFTLESETKLTSLVRNDPKYEKLQDWRDALPKPKGISQRQQSILDRVASK